MSRAAVAVAELTAKATRLLPPVDDELRFDFDLGEAPAKPVSRARAAWNSEAQGVKAAIIRWLEEQV